VHYTRVIEWNWRAINSRQSRAEQSSWREAGLYHFLLMLQAASLLLLDKRDFGIDFHAFFTKRSGYIIWVWNKFKAGKNK
jgi:hypothetical protein